MNINSITDLRALCRLTGNPFFDLASARRVERVIHRHFVKDSPRKGWFISSEMVDDRRMYFVHRYTYYLADSYVIFDTLAKCETEGAAKEILAPHKRHPVHTYRGKPIKSYKDWLGVWTVVVDLPEGGYNPEQLNARWSEVIRAVWRTTVGGINASTPGGVPDEKIRDSFHLVRISDLVETRTGKHFRVAFHVIANSPT